MSDENLDKIYDVLEKPMIKILSKLETTGIKVDDVYLKKLSKKFEERLIKIEKDIYKISGKEFNKLTIKSLLFLNTFLISILKD